MFYIHLIKYSSTFTIENFIQLQSLVLQISVKYFSQHLFLPTDHKIIYGYEILSTVFFFSAYAISLVLLLIERHRLLPTVPTRGHGIVLLVFWTLAFVKANLSFLNWFSNEWWWQKKRYPLIYF